MIEVILGILTIVATLIILSAWLTYLETRWHQCPTCKWYHTAHCYTPLAPLGIDSFGEHQCQHCTETKEFFEKRETEISDVVKFNFSANPDQRHGLGTP